MQHSEHDSAIHQSQLRALFAYIRALEDDVTAATRRETTGAESEPHAGIESSPRPSHPADPPMTAPTVLAAVCSDNFEPGFIVTVNSLLEHNPWFDLEIRVLSHPEVAPLSPDVRARLSRIYDNLSFVDADLTQQQAIRERMMAASNTPNRLQAAYLSLEAFRFTDAERVVALDIDTLVMGDVRELFQLDDPFAAVEAQRLKSGGAGFFNAGVFVIGERHLSGSTYDELAGFPLDDLNYETGFGEQIILNSYFESREMTWLPTKYNTQKRLLPDSLGDVEAALAERDTRILHYAGDKPWHAKEPRHVRGYEEVEHLWRDAFARYAQPGDMERMLSLRRQKLESWIAEQSPSPSPTT